jgi:hypothetical protein
LPGAESELEEMRRVRTWVKFGLVLTIAGIPFCYYYVKAHPLVFNESLWQHAHCMPQVTLSLRQYASEHGGRFPYHTNGYGDALLMLKPEINGYWNLLTGPGYSASAFEEGDKNSSDVDERRCGRVYVQGLSENNNPEIAVIFDKVASPGDHCHFPRRLWRQFGRDVGFIDGHWRPVSELKWLEFVKQQVDLLVEAGFTKEQAEALYAETK